jgi:putative two-component system response regulator
MENKKKILVADDEERNRVLVEAMLHSMGYDVVLAKDGIEALDLAHSESPDVILLDIMMPKMDGFETAIKLRSNEETKLIPVVMVTALHDVEDRVRALNAGADDFLTKPINKTELSARVQSLVKVKAYNDYMKNYQKDLEEEVARKTLLLREALHQIKIASLDTILRLSYAAEYKDENTGSHIQRVSLYAAAIARQMGMDDETVDSILYASLMHDIGKIGIPDYILLKSSSLDIAEWKIMRQHTTIGAAIMKGSSSNIVQLAEQIALNHHEKWDGSGYPQGLSGTDIPLVGRIVIVADVFDALTSNRPYKKTISVEKAFTIIHKRKGTHFDPAVVDAFFAIKDEIRKIISQKNNDKEYFLRGLDNVNK